MEKNQTNANSGVQQWSTTAESKPTHAASPPSSFLPTMHLLFASLLQPQVLNWSNPDFHILDVRGLWVFTYRESLVGAILKTEQGRNRRNSALPWDTRDTGWGWVGGVDWIRNIQIQSKIFLQRFSNQLMSGKACEKRKNIGTKLHGYHSVFVKYQLGNFLGNRSTLRYLPIFGNLMMSIE